MIVHQLVEEFANMVAPAAGDQVETAVVNALASFYPRARARALLREVVEAEAAWNPRVDAKKLLGTVTIDECLNQFKSIIWTRLPVLHGSKTPTGNGPKVSAIRNGHEVELKAERPPLMGRLDMVQGGVIYDFKTGEPQPSHAEQLTFYALLYYLAVGRAPVGLALVYSSQSAPFTVPVPTRELLEEMKGQISDETQRMQDVIQSGAAPEARCAAETCRNCPVRQHCDEYWEAPTTVRLRGESLAQMAGDCRPHICWADIELTTLPSGWLLGRSCVGWTEVSGLGSVLVRIAQDRTPDSLNRWRGGARILNASITRAATCWEVTATGQAEVFWVSRSSPSRRM